MSRSARMVIDVILQRGACRQTDEGFLQNVREGDRIALCQTVGRRNDQRQMILRNRLELQPRRLHGIRDDSRLGQSSRNRPHDLLARALLELKTYAWPIRQPGREPAGQEFR